FELQILLNAILTQDLGCELIYVLRTDHIKLLSEDSIAWTLDGEFGGDQTEVEINVEKCALKLLTPANDK
ncbi:MAG: diacylglycerol kinase family lipid kinase, partial [Oscillospiraceae bacterium]